MTAELERWDEWFAATKDQVSIKTWEAAKEVYGGDTVKLDVWATIIELNRRDRLKNSDPS